MNRKPLVVLRLLRSQIISFGKILFLLITVQLVYVSALAQDADAPPPKPAPAIAFRVIRQRVVESDGQSVVLNRVAPPLLPQEPAAPAPTTQEADAAKQAVPEPPAKKSVILFLSATVYDHKITAIGFMGGSSKAGIFSNIDFNLLAGVGNIETGGAIYSLMLAVNNQSADDAATHNRQLAGQGTQMAWNRIPNREEFSAKHSECIVVEDATHQAPTGDELAALNVLHVFFDANKPRIAEAKAERETARADAQRQLEEHPPAPQDIVIHYWKNHPAPIPPGP